MFSKGEVFFVEIRALLHGYLEKLPLCMNGRPPTSTAGWLFVARIRVANTWKVVRMTRTSGPLPLSTPTKLVRRG